MIAKASGLGLLLMLLGLSSPSEAMAPSPPLSIPLASFHAVTVAPVPTSYSVSTLKPRSSKPKPKNLVGKASWYASWCDCVAMRRWRGQTVLVEGPQGSRRVVINDYGPSKRLFPERVIDLNPSTFQNVCGNLSRGTCTVRVTLLN